MKKTPKTQPGFTFVELMFAIVVLGTMLSLTMSIFVGMLRFYTFSNQIRQNQQNGRNILDSMDREIRFSQLVDAAVKNDPGVKSDYLCVYNESQRKAIKYYKAPNSYNLKKLEFTASELAVAKSGCENQTDGKIVNLANMKVDVFEVVKTQGAAFSDKASTGAVKIRLSFVTGNASADAAGLYCETRNIYCNKLEYNTVVNLRQ